METFNFLTLYSSPMHWDGLLFRRLWRRAEGTWLVTFELENLSLHNARKPLSHPQNFHQSKDYIKLFSWFAFCIPGKRSPWEIRRYVCGTGPLLSHWVQVVEFSVKTWCGSKRKGGEMFYHMEIYSEQDISALCESYQVIKLIFTSPKC